MGIIDRAKAALGRGARARERTGAAGDAHADGTVKRAPKKGRPPLPEVVAIASAATLDDVFAARDAGDSQRARALLAGLDKGQGLRTVLRAAAALEAGDDAELARLLPAVAREPAWPLCWQVAAALDPGDRRRALVAETARQGAPPWALAWLQVAAADEGDRRTALVDLLFADPALARTVAARDLALPTARVDNSAIRQYSSFAHSRDTIRRFGADLVARLLERVPRSSP